ncbi:MAG: hypothetical protein U0802_14750 [Candidatus Binatia bacterium]
MSGASGTSCRSSNRRRPDHGGGALTVAARQVVGTSVAALPACGQAWPASWWRRAPATAADHSSAPKPITVGAASERAQIGQPLGGSVVDGPSVLFTWSRVPGDTGSNTTYRVFVQDLSRQTTALDVLTTALTSTAPTSAPKGRATTCW